MKKILTQSFILCVCLLVGAELFARIFFSRNASGRFEYGYNQTAGFIEDENTVKLIRAGGRRFRPQQFAKPKPKGVIRIFTIGDSVPRGNTLEDSYPKQIENFLKIYGLDAESFNLGVAGNGVRRNQLILKQILNYQPDFVILHINYSNEFEDEREWRRSQEFKSWHPKNWLMKSFILRRIYEIKLEQAFWALLPDKVREQTAKNDFDAKIRAMSSEQQENEWKQLVMKTIREDLEILKEAGVKTILVSLVTSEKKDGHFIKIEDTWLSDFAESLTGPQVIHVSPYKTLQDHDPDKVFADEVHLKDYGHSLLASAIATRIMDISFSPFDSPSSPEPQKGKRK